MKVGDTIYYREKHGAPGYYQTAVILGETSRSWLVGRGEEWWSKYPEQILAHARKIAKNGTVFVFKEQAELQQWAFANRYFIAQMVERSADGAVLKKIAELIGYAEKTLENKAKVG